MDGTKLAGGCRHRRSLPDPRAVHAAGLHQRLPHRTHPRGGGKDGRTDWVLCFKSAGDREGLSREEIEFSISPDQFGQLEKLIGLPLIPKARRTYLLPDGLHLEVNLVDEGLPTEFMYAEIEYPSEDQARSWDPAVCGPAGLADYLRDDVTGDPGQTMGAYWAATRL